jgi:hypothetical protein
MPENFPELPNLLIKLVLGWVSYAFVGLGFYAFPGSVGVSVGIFFGSQGRALCFARSSGPQPTPY